MKNCVALLSGGLDSSLVVHLMAKEGYEIYPLFINYGQLNINKECRAATLLCSKIGTKTLEILDIQDYGRLIPSGLTNEALHIVKDAFLPGRNALFLLCAAAYAYSIGVQNITIGLLNSSDSIFPDQTKEFLASMQQLICTSISPGIKIIAPLSTFFKTDVIKLAKDENIINTYSCHAGGDSPCGKCIACKEFKGG